MRWILVAALAMVALAGCGEDAQQQQAIRELESAREALERERRQLRRERREEAEGSPSREEAQKQPGAPGSPSQEKATVPDVVGQDHQLAQDKLQAAGFYALSEEDATGQGRALVLDRNWTVVSQSPRAGTRAPVDRTIVLRSKKDGE